MLIMSLMSNSANIIKVQQCWNIPLKLLKTVVKWYLKEKSKLAEGSKYYNLKQDDCAHHIYIQFVFSRSLVSY